MAHFAQPARVPRESRGPQAAFGRQPELGLLRSSGRRPEFMTQSLKSLLHWQAPFEGMLWVLVGVGGRRRQGDVRTPWISCWSPAKF